ncbi:MAG: hypothetical protein AAGL10_09705 [Pseudomonadota bacterium]
MRTAIATLIAALSLCVSPLSAQNDSSETDKLEPLRFLVGHCWQASFPGTEATDTHCWEEMLGGVFIRDTHVVEGRPEPYSGEAIYGVSADAQLATFTYFNSLGGTSAGQMVNAGDRLMFPGEMHQNADGSTIVLRSVMVRVGEHEYIMTTEQQTAKVWSELWSLKFQKLDGSPRAD